MQGLAGTQLAPWKPVTGDNLFTRESGAVAAQFHDPPAIEPYASELGLDVPEERFAALLEAVKRAGTKKRDLVTDAEFRRMASRVKNTPV